MSVRHQHNRIKSDIMEKDYNMAVKKAKVRFRTDKRYRIGNGKDEFFIIKVMDYYTAVNNLSPVFKENIISHFYINDFMSQWQEELNS